jgi:hypothetical protein
MIKAKSTNNWVGSNTDSSKYLYGQISNHLNSETVATGSTHSSMTSTVNKGQFYVSSNQIESQIIEEEDMQDVNLDLD